MLNETFKNVKEKIDPNIVLHVRATALVFLKTPFAAKGFQLGAFQFYLVIV